MKKTRKLFAAILAVVMLFSIMSISTYASPEDPEVTVYFTTNMFSPGGYVDGVGPVISTYRSDYDPQEHSNTGFSYLGIKVKRSEILANLASIRGEYAPAGYTSNPNILDAVIFALKDNNYTVSCGWDSYNTPNGGYINSYSPNGVAVTYPTYMDTKTETIGGVEVETDYYVYSGIGIRYAFGTNGNITEPSLYATNYEISDGMEIVVDYSYYQFYYPAD